MKTSARSFASQAGASSSNDTSVSTFAKIMVFCMLLILAAKVLPALGQASTEHVMMLLGADEPFWQHSGLQRAKWLAKTDAGIEKLLQAGAAQRLVNIIEDSKDRDCRKTALDVVEEMSRLYEAREAFVLAGLMGILKQQAKLEDESFEQRTQLLIQYRVQQNHVE